MTNMQDKARPIKLSSTAMQEVYSRVERFARTKVPILITGDTGVGKEIIAHEIHKNEPAKCQTVQSYQLQCIPG